MFFDRHEAGQVLARQLHKYKGQSNTVVLGLARGGVVAAFEVASKLSLPLNVAVPRKIGAPGNPELAIGAIAENNAEVLNDYIINALHIPPSYIAQEIQKEKARMEERLNLYRQHAPLPTIKDQIVILVDDGMATGATMLATIQSMRQAQARYIVVATPAASSQALSLVEEKADEVVCLLSRVDFGGVALYYQDFSQTSDQEVIHLLQTAQINYKLNFPHNESSVSIPIGESQIEGDLIIPQHAKTVVLFAHGSGSSRFSPRNRFVAEFLRKNGLATLLMDLLTLQEEEIDRETRELRFDIDLLAQRLMETTNWLAAHNQTKHLKIGYFGSSTGAAAALIAAAQKGSLITSVVSRGGRPDLAEQYLSRVQSPTLLIVGGDDTEVIKLNHQAYDLLNCEKKLEIIPQASHLFEEAGALEKVAELASSWFLQHETD
jgi:putative phosphoribosyl transferase